MHYKNGREAKLGDKVISKDGSAGTLVSANPGSTTCNGQLVPPGAPTLYVTLKDCLHVDDVFANDSKPTS